MIEHLLLATDFSTRSDRALRRATMLAKPLGAAVSLVHVVDSDQPPHMIDAQAQISRLILSDTVRTIKEHDGIAASSNVVVDDVFSGILQQAHGIAADLIIVGPHRRQLRDGFVGTTAERTIAHSQCPVLMTAGIPSGPYDRALIALDLGEEARSIVSYVQASAILGRAEIVAMHAFDAPAHGMMKRAMQEQEAIDHYLANEEDRAHKAFGRVIAEAGLQSDHSRLLPVNGTVARTILDCARAEKTDLIVVGTSQRRGLERFIVGNVAEDLLKDAESDVLIVPTGGRDQPFRRKMTRLSPCARAFRP